MNLRVFLPVVVLAAVTAGGHAQNAQPDLILHNGHIFTGDLATPWVEAVSIQGDHILSVGADGAITATAGPHTRVIDLQGRMAMPGINDSHDHAGGAHYGVLAKTKKPAMADPSLEDIAEAVRAAVKAAPDGGWIFAQVGPAAIRHPREAVAAMNEAGGGHPVLVEAWWGHGVIVNSAGVAKLGLTDAVVDPPGGHFDRDSDGHLTGLAEEYAGTAIKDRLIAEMGIPPAVTEFREYAEGRLREGVTTVQVMGSNGPLHDLEQTLVQADTSLRLRLIRWPMPGQPSIQSKPFVRGTQQLSPLVRVSGVKYVLDGTPIEELAFQTRDYADRPGWRGRPNFSKEFISEQLKAALDGKDQLTLHVVGDAMTDEVLDLMEKLAPAARWQPLRVRFEHGDGLNTPERMERAHRLGIVVAQPRPGRPFKALLDAGIPLAYGSDGGMAPFFMFAQMTMPKNPQSISKLQALSILTSGPAFAEFQEKSKGKLKPGMLADITVLSQDVMTAAPEALPATRSLLAIVGGKIAYTSPQLSAEVHEAHKARVSVIAGGGLDCVACGKGDSEAR